MGNWRGIAEQVAAATGRSFSVESARHVGGGCINDAIVLEGDSYSCFVKLNQPHLLDMFEAEAAGLDEIRKADAIRAPRPLASGIADGQAFLALEYVPLGGSGSPADFGERLAAMHRYTAPSFGWGRNNTIGSTPQINDWMGDWIEFWRERRLRYQLDLAARNGQRSLRDQADPLLEDLPRFFETRSPQPSLLHGDLWGGNYGYDSDGNPVIYDPAVYYGDREADIAMTELFGGFGARFYDAYNAAYPLDAGYGARKTLYNLYHILNHFNLFGGGYASQALSMIQRLRAELG